MRTNALGLAAVVFILSVPAPAGAVPITFAFTGTLYDVPAVLVSEFGIGDPVNGFFTFESTTPPSPFPDGNAYDAAITSLAGTAGSYAFAGMAPTGIYVQEAIGFDAYDARSNNMTGSLIGSYVPFSVVLAMFDTSGTMLSGTALPFTPPVLPPYAIIEFTFKSSSDFPPTAQAYAHLDSLTLQEQDPVVPEPGTLFLVGGGIAAAFFCRRKRSTEC